MPNELLTDKIHLPPPNTSSPANKKYHITFITGNPGLIEYYRQFLTHLHALLNISSNNAKSHTGAHDFTVSGSSLVGFEVSKSLEGHSKAWKPLGLQHEPPFNLVEVIDAAEKNVLSSVLETGGGDGVILVGHSVGAYITLEIIQRHRARLEKLRRLGSGEPRIVGGICLFPTIEDIGESPRGKALTVSP